VRQVRGRYTGTYGEQVALAKEFDVPVSVIRKALRGESWASLVGTKVYRIASGAKHGRAKITDYKVRQMRRLHTEGHRVPSLAKRYGVTPAIARDIIHGKTWKHIGGVKAPLP